MEPASSSTASAQGRRTNPSRSRRGGPGVGTCDVDIMILETYKRKLENEPLIPTDTPFLLTTNSSKFSGDSANNSESTISINTVANDRYFDRPEVLKAFREQEIIQTPEFWAISESSTVGGRFRPRGAEDDSAETSDAAYEKRHKKFETFEKRQRLREKEKLKHEHYKLKERIDQLRAMDSAAFMAVPASSFSPMPQPPTNELDEAAVTASPYAQVNGAALHAEGERRRKEMLDHAISLEKRYSYLLPPDRVRKTQDSFISERNQVDGRDEEESETERISHAGPSKKEIESIKFRIPARSSTSTTPAPSPAAAKLPPTKKGRASAQPRQPLSARSIQSTISLSVPPQDQVPSTATTSPYIDVEMQTPEPAPISSPPPPSASPLLPTEVPEPLHTPLLDIEVTSSRPPTPVRPLNGRTRAQKDVSALPNIISNGAEVQPSVKVTARQAPRPRGIEVRTQDEGESEKAPSEDGNAQAGEEAVAAELISKPDEAAEVEAEAKMLGPDEVAPEVREISTRMEQATFAGAPGMGVEGPEVPSERFDHQGRTAEGLSHAVSPGAEESISTRPLKRQRKMSAKARAQSIAQSHARRTPSAPPIPESVSSRLGRKFGPRGQQSQTYLSSTTGEEVRTTSFLMMAAIRSEGAKRSSEKRHLSSFGIVTPAFKENYDFEIPEWLHYPDDEEPAIPIPDDTIAVDQVEPVPEVLAKAVEGEGQTVPEPAEPQEAMDTDTVEPNVEEETEPTQPEVAETETVEPTESSDAIQVDETEPAPAEPEEPIQVDEPVQETAEPMETEPTEPTENDDEASPPTEPEPEPGVGIRVLSNPRDDEDEQLEW